MGDRVLVFDFWLADFYFFKFLIFLILFSFRFLCFWVIFEGGNEVAPDVGFEPTTKRLTCLLYTSDAADERG